MAVKVDLELDLHGLTIEAALARVQSFLNSDKMRAGMVIRLIHGRSNRSDDSIRTQVKRFLEVRYQSSLSDVYEEPANPGATLMVVDRDFRRPGRSQKP